LARFVFPSEYLYRQANERHRLHMHASILPFGADETVFYPSPRRPLPATPVVGQPPQVLYVGPVAEGHGLHTLLDAMRLLARRGVEAELRVIERPGFCADGQKRRDGQDVDAYRRGLRAQRGTNARFEPYLGPAQVADAMRSAAVVCCPALEPEAFCTCSVESMACAVPVAASSTGAVPDVFTQGGGLLLPPGDPGALADALERLLGKTGLARIVGRDGRESFLRNYRWSIIASAYLDLVASLPRGERQLQAQTFQTGRLVR
jgi:glycosyltransferase involved in cell wall biosynthesis